MKVRNEILQFISVAQQGISHCFHPPTTLNNIQHTITGINPGGGGMGDVSPPPPTFLGGGGMACTNIPPLFEDKITLSLTFIVKKLTFLTAKLLKTQKIARSLRSLAHKCILRLDLCGFTSILLS